MAPLRVWTISTSPKFWTVAMPSRAPRVGTRVRQMQPFGVVESVKAVSDLFAPLSGEVVEVNPGLTGHPEQVNQDPYGSGWLIVIAIAEAKELDALMSVADYEKFLQMAGGH